ncbi:MAG: hypothetical protein ACOCZE_13740, partial [Planctomycetota bacterium]
MAGTTPVQFETFGRAYHLQIRSAQQLRQILDLDEAHWVATSAPISTIHCDAALCSFVDADASGQITCRDLKQAVSWMFSVLCDTGGIDSRAEQIRVAQIDQTSGDGERIVDALNKIIDRIDAPADAAVSLGHVRQVMSREEALPVNEAGVLLPQAARDEPTRLLIKQILTTVGGTDHPSGAKGVGRQSLARFTAAVRDYLVWYDAGQIPADQQTSDTQPLGEQTAEAFQSLSPVIAKIDQYFAQCEAVALDPGFSVHMGWSEEELGQIDFDNPDAIRHVLAGAPIARARPDRVLDLTEGVNPYYQQMLAAAAERAISPALGRAVEQLTAAEWLDVKRTFDPYAKWIESQPDPAVVKLGIERLRQIAGQDDLTDGVEALLAETDRRAFVMDNLRLAEKLLLYQKHLLELANNIVSFPRLYDPSGRAMLEMGTLIMDGRRFNLAVKVENRNEHLAVAGTSNIFVIYVEIQPPQSGAKFEVACPVVWGDKGNLTIGKRGIFHDVQGRECSARVVEIIENPVSILEALAMPFKRIGRMITGKIESIASSAEKQFDTRAAGAIDQVPVGQGQTPPPAPATPGRNPAMLMGAGLTIAAVGSAAAYITKTLAGVG